MTHTSSYVCLELGDGESAKGKVGAGHPGSGQPCVVTPTVPAEVCQDQDPSLVSIWFICLSKEKIQFCAL